MTLGLRITDWQSNNRKAHSNLVFLSSSRNH
jgi:hypothetical protein